MAVRTNSRSVMPVLCALCAVALLATMRSAHAQKSTYFNNIPGDYCRTRGDPCCILRQDECSVPILGTLCYCDEFCNRDDNPDCCPDYAPVCLGVIPKPPTPLRRDCFHNGQTILTGDSVQDNCNSCTCMADEKVSCSNLKCLTDLALLQQLSTDDAYSPPGGSQWGWTATNYSMFWGKPLHEGLIKKTGTRDVPMIMYPVYLDYDSSTIPSEFDAREKWPFKISRPRDQGWCGSSWAFSTASVATDRLAIESDGIEAVPLSVQSLISCDRIAMQGCEGGVIVRAWQYLRKHGVVDEKCDPYTSGGNGIKGQCRIPRRADFGNLQCDASKQAGVGREALYRTEPAYRIRSREADIQYEIMTNGPVQASMRVNQEFFYYRRGVYSSTGLRAPQEVGYHSVRLIGWGEQISNFMREPIKYWLAVNSWGEEWGEGGLFKIVRGVNESGIEERILAVRAALLIDYPPPQFNRPDPDLSKWFFD